MPRILLYIPVLCGVDLDLRSRTVLRYFLTEIRVLGKPAGKEDVLGLLSDLPGTFARHGLTVTRSLKPWFLFSFTSSTCLSIIFIAPPTLFAKIPSRSALREDGKDSIGTCTNTAALP